jgi:acetyltransferase
VSIRNLDRLFKPGSVALIGASARPGSIGDVLTHNLLAGGLAGEVMLVNPKHASIGGQACFPDVASLPETPDLAVVAVPAHAVPGVVEALARRGAAGAVVISAGFAERGPQGQALQDEMLAATGATSLRIVGPNCLGVLVPHAGLNASFSHLPAREGGIAFVTQSGAIVTTVLDWAQPRGIGFSHLVSLGAMADVDFGDMMDYLANDPRTDAILLYIEAIKEPRKFMSASRAAARMKPVLAVKGARHEQTARVAMSHTGALAGADAVYDAAFRRAGIVRVYTLEELFDAVETLAVSQVPRPGTSDTRKDRLAIITNGGGLGVLAADALADRGGTLAELAPSTIERLNAVLPQNWSHANPVDIVGDAPGSRYQQTVEVVAQDPGVDGVLVINCPTAVVSRTEAAEAVVRARGQRRRVPLLTSFVGAETAAEPRLLLTRERIPTYETPEDAVHAFMHLVDYAERQRLLMETPPSLPEVVEPDTARARAILDVALDEEREWLTAPEAKAVLDAYGLLTPPGRTALDAAGAAEAAAALGGPVALKILSPDITHKSDVGGVVLGLEGPLLVRDAAEKLMRSIGEQLPEARIDGVVVESMVHRPGAIELIVGAYEDPSFGPVLVFGRGGTAAEVIRDRALALPPLNLHLAHELIRRTRVYERLKGYRNVPAVNLDAVATALVRVGQLIADLPEIRELDINPLLADPYGVIALDARIRIEAYHGSPQARLAIRPYPVELEEEIDLADGRTLLLRPIRPEDEPALARAFGRLTPEEIRFRFFIPWKTFSHMVTARFTQIDYDRDMVMILTERGAPDAIEIYGVVQLNALPRGEGAEFAILVERSMAGLGLGPYLLRRIIDYARSRGIAEIHGDVLADNTAMLGLCRALGFTAAADPVEPSVIRVSRSLHDAVPA